MAMLGLTYLLLAGEEARRPPLQPPSSFCTLLLGWPFLRRNQPQAGGGGKMLVHQRIRWGKRCALPPTPLQLFYFTFRLASSATETTTTTTMCLLHHSMHHRDVSHNKSQHSWRGQKNKVGGSKKQGGGVKKTRWGVKKTGGGSKKQGGGSEKQVLLESPLRIGLWDPFQMAVS